MAWGHALTLIFSGTLEADSPQDNGGFVCPTTQGNRGQHVLPALSPLEITELDFSFSDSL